MKTYQYCTICLSTLVVLAGIALAQSPQPSKPAELTYKYVDVQADKTRYKWGNSEIVVLTGNVKMTQGDTVLTADKIEYNENEDVQTAIATGSVKVVDPETEITGEKGSAFFNEKRSVIKGNVKVVAKPKPSSDDNGKKTVRSQFKDKAVMTCDKIDYLYKKKEATASGNLNILQKDRTLTAGQVFYDVKKELLTLTGGVKGRDSKGQTFSAPGPVVVSIKEGDEWLEMEHAVGKFRVKEEEEEKESKPGVTVPPPSAGATQAK